MNDYQVLFPYDLIEILNGVLGTALFWMTFFVSLHLHRAWRATRRGHSGLSGFKQSVSTMYRTYKPEIALLTISSAFCVRTYILWYVRWLKNNDIDWTDWITDNSAQLLTAFTIIIIVGVACWIRVISPYVGRTAVFLWFLMVLSSALFGIGMHLVF